MAGRKSTARPSSADSNSSASSGAYIKTEPADGIEVVGNPIIRPSSPATRADPLTSLPPRPDSSASKLRLDHDNGPSETEANVISDELRLSLRILGKYAKSSFTEPALNNVCDFIMDNTTMASASQHPDRLLDPLARLLRDADIDEARVPEIRSNLRGIVVKRLSKMAEQIGKPKASNEDVATATIRTHRSANTDTLEEPPGKRKMSLPSEVDQSSPEQPARRAKKSKSTSSLVADTNAKDERKTKKPRNSASEETAQDAAGASEVSTQSPKATKSTRGSPAPRRDNRAGRPSSTPRQNHNAEINPSQLANPPLPKAMAGIGKPVSASLEQDGHPRGPEWQPTLVQWVYNLPLPGDHQLLLPTGTPEASMVPRSGRALQDWERACEIAFGCPRYAGVRPWGEHLWTAIFETPDLAAQHMGRSVWYQGQQIHATWFPRRPPTVFVADLGTTNNIEPQDVVTSFEAAFRSLADKPKLMLQSSVTQHARRKLLAFLPPKLTLLRFYLPVKQKRCPEPSVLLFGPLKLTKPCWLCNFEHPNGDCSQTVLLSPVVQAA